MDELFPRGRLHPLNLKRQESDYPGPSQPNQSLVQVSCTNELSPKFRYIFLL